MVSAQHLPKRNRNDTAAVSPFVKVKIFGVRCGESDLGDRRTEPYLCILADQNAQRTSAVPKNGLNPIWNHLMQFSISIPELCLIRITVKDSDKSNTDLGQYAIPLLSMQSGTVRCSQSLSYDR